MTSKFEQLIEYVINDEEAKAKELFHDIVVEKSREIYENLMNEEHACSDCGKVECVCEDEEEESINESDMEEEVEEGTSGDAAEDLMREVETDEEGMYEEDDADADFDDEAEEDGKDLTKDMEHDHDEGDIEDRVIDLEDKLDELMAEFESMLGDGGTTMEPKDDEVGGDAYAMDDTSEFEDEPMPMSENITLDKVPAPTHGDNGANPKSPTAFNSGAAGMAAKPVRNVASEANPDGTSAYKKPSNEYSKGEGDLPNAGKFKNTPAKGGYGSKLEAAPKPVTAQAAGTNTKTPFPKA